MLSKQISLPIIARPKHDPCPTNDILTEKLVFFGQILNMLSKISFTLIVISQKNIDFLNKIGVLAYLEGHLSVIEQIEQNPSEVS